MDKVEFVPLYLDQEDKIQEMSDMASTIVKEHFDPIIGPEQNDYMIKRFQSVASIRDQLNHGYHYYFTKVEGENVGFCAFYPRTVTREGREARVLYLSKFYIYKERRGHGYARAMNNFVVDECKKASCEAVELNVNINNNAIGAYKKMGYVIDRNEKNSIGEGFFMDDYVMRLEVSS